MKNLFTSESCDKEKTEQKQLLLIRQLDLLLEQLPRFIKVVTLNQYEIELECSSERLLSLMRFLRDHTYTKYNQLVDIVSIDYLGQNKRFVVKYLLLSLSFNSRIIIAVRASDFEMLPSVTALFKSAAWLEREAWDMMGIPFKNHLDLRRILTDYGFLWHPLRKDFPLSGFHELYYDESLKRIVKEPVSLSQEYRNFTFRLPWRKM